MGEMCLERIQVVLPVFSDMALVGNYCSLKHSLGYQQHSFRLLLLCTCITGIIQATDIHYVHELE
jgi:hypothetical protein